MKRLLVFIKNISFNSLFFIVSAIIILLFVFSFFFGIVFVIAKTGLLGLVTLSILDVLILHTRKGVFAERVTDGKLSNGDYNSVTVRIKNSYPFPVSVEIIDEIPFQFQKRDFSIRRTIAAGMSVSIVYSLRPTERGEYHFGAMHVYASSLLKLVNRHFRFSDDTVVPVYPSIIQMKKYDLFAISNRLTEVGAKKIRRIGASMEFDQIRNYVTGDDIRNINWKATARRNEVMVNHYKDERSQHVYSVINMGRVMKMPFLGMSLLDYAINASLVISNIALRKEDKAGVITYSNKIESFLPAKGAYTHIREILEVLYNVSTDYYESDYERLYVEISNKIHQRSLILLFTNFETLSSMKRNMKYLAMIAKKHFLVTIFFRNTELRELLDSSAYKTEDVYIKTIAEKFAYEKKQVVKELQIHGIQAMLTSPENLTINTINKYLELKARGLL